jgi:hypothetical protein
MLLYAANLTICQSTCCYPSAEIAGAAGLEVWTDRQVSTHNTYLMNDPVTAHEGQMIRRTAVQSSSPGCAT